MKQSQQRQLEELQSNFPLVPRPYREISRRLRLSEQGVVDKIRLLKKKGTIRYIGAVFNSRKLGFYSTLVAARAPKAKIKKAVRIINAYPSVTHNYLRDDEFNLWFTVTASSPGKLLNIIREIKKRAGLKDVLNLKTLKLFKINAKFKLSTNK